MIYGLSKSTSSAIVNYIVMSFSVKYKANFTQFSILTYNVMEMLGRVSTNVLYGMEARGRSNGDLVASSLSRGRHLPV